MRSSLAWKAVGSSTPSSIGCGVRSTWRSLRALCSRCRLRSGRRTVRAGSRLSSRRIARSTMRCPLLALIRLFRLCRPGPVVVIPAATSNMWRCSSVVRGITGFTVTRSCGSPLLRMGCGAPSGRLGLMARWRFRLSIMAMMLRVTCATTCRLTRKRSVSVACRRVSVRCCSVKLSARPLLRRVPTSPRVTIEMTRCG